MVRSDIKDFLNTIPKNVTLVAATKYVDVDDMEMLLNAGINNFGENRTEAFLQKYTLLQNKDICWHFIGHLQRNKALNVINKIDYLHSLDSLKLAKIIDEKYEGTSTDIWSCGIILYAMLCGTLPYAESKEDIICRKILTHDYQIPEYLAIFVNNQ